MYQTVQVYLGDESYPVLIGREILHQALERMNSFSEIAMITDDNVALLSKFFKIEKTLASQAKKFVKCVVPAGEGSKNLTTYAKICSELAQNRMSRGCLIVAVGGGVIGDLSGFVSATYLRGVSFVQIPTTLLAAVDSSVGGKTGVNIPEGKNLVGAVHQPAEVVIEMGLLETLPQREFASGMAEVIKCGVIRDPSLLSEIRKDGVQEQLQDIIRRCVQIKANVVSADERDETGERAVLNFGHTIGHAIEQSSGYRRWTHGEAVAIGMMGVMFLSEKIFDLSHETTEVVRQTLESQGLPTQAEGLDEEKIMEAIARDKKVTESGVKWVLVPKLGQTELTTEVSEGLVREAIRFCQKS